MQHLRATSFRRLSGKIILRCKALGRKRLIVGVTILPQVALKAMMVIHRTLREGDPTFRDELLNYARNRGHVLNLSNFKDDSSTNGMYLLV